MLPLTVKKKILIFAKHFVKISSTVKEFKVLSTLNISFRSFQYSLEGHTSKIQNLCTQLDTLTKVLNNLKVHTPVMVNSQASYASVGNEHHLSSSHTEHQTPTPNPAYQKPTFTNTV